MKLSKSAAGILFALYKSVLIKCLLANLMLFSLPAAAETISDETHANETFDSPSDGSYQINGGTFENSSIDASSNITVSAGTFTESGLYADHDIKISDGTFSESELYAGNDIEISGGAFADSYIGADNITILGGTLTNSSFRLYDDLIINGGKIEGTLSVGISPDISIASDAAVVNLTWDKNSATPPSSITAHSLSITGDRGIFVSNTAFSSLTTSGKITANSNSFLGQFWGTDDYVYHSIDGKTLHTASRGYNHSNNTQRTVFSDANIVLNGDSVAGSGYYSLSFDLWTPPRRPPMGSPKIRPYSLTAENAPFQILRKELTQDEIDTAINFIWNDVNNASSYDKLTDFTKAVLGLISSGSNTPSITKIKEHETAFKTLLTEHYENFNSFLNASVNTNVIISASTFVLNDNAKLINDSFSSDYNAGHPCPQAVSPPLERAT